MAVNRPDHELDFSEPDRAAPDGSSPLRRLILAQLEQPEGAAVHLLTSAALTSSDPLGPRDGVAATARDVGVDAGEMELFSADAYLLQSALGERVLGGAGRLPDDGVLACNVHDIPPEGRRAVEERLSRLCDVGPVLDLDADVEAAAGPRVVVAFYDSYREAALFGADLCHRLGLRAWFFPLFDRPADEPGTAALSDVDLADLATEHELCFHTASHVRVDQVDESNLRREVVDVHARLTELAGRPPRIGAWRGGSRWDDRYLANRTLRDLGLPTLISNWSIETVPPPATASP